MDHGSVWVPIHQYVKAFFWSPSRVLLVERIEPIGLNTVLKFDVRNLSTYQKGSNILRTRMNLRKEFTVVIQNIQDFQIRGDYMFATSKKSSKVNITLFRI